MKSNKKTEQAQEKKGKIRVRRGDGADEEVEAIDDLEEVKLEFGDFDFDCRCRQT